jgi:hypothetical protein
MNDVIGSQYALAPGGAPIQVGGLIAYPAIDARDPAHAVIALQTRASLPPRSRLIHSRPAAPVPYSMMPLEQGTIPDPAGAAAFFVVCPAPPGPCLAADPRPWQESEILRFLLHPAAAALEAMDERGLTHRAIRPDNIFRAGPGEKVMLGPCWAAPPGSLQPSPFEPPYAAQCLPTARGEGSTADDVYALGVTMLWCVLGGVVPGWGDEPALLKRKLNLGSLAALAGQARLSPSMADLLRGMLAEDPDHRPAAALLLDPEQARSRRVATRPAARAQRPLEFAGTQIWFPRELARALSAAPDEGAVLLRNGTIGAWLRRVLGDAALALRVDEAVARGELAGDSAKATHGMVCRAAAVLDPLAPLAWRGHAVFPDGVGTALAHAVLTGQTALVAALEEILSQDATAAWLAGRIPRAEYTRMQQEVRDWKDWLSTPGVAGGLPRVLYGANPLLPCLSPLLNGRSVVSVSDLLPALEACAPEADRKRPPIDAHIASFIAARADPTTLGDAVRLTGFVSPTDRLSVMGALGRLQQRTVCEALPRLAAWLLESGMAELGQWRSLATRKAMLERLENLAAQGAILPMVVLLQDPHATGRDAAEAAEAARRLGEIEATLNALRESGQARREQARGTGQEIATGLSLLSLLGGAIAVLVGG